MIPCSPGCKTNTMWCEYKSANVRHWWTNRVLLLYNEHIARGAQRLVLVALSDRCRSSVIWELSVLLVDGQQQLPLVHADSCVVSFSWQLSVFVDKPSLSQHICCGNFYLVRGFGKSLRRVILSSCIKSKRKHCYLLHMLRNQPNVFNTVCFTYFVSYLTFEPGFT